MKDDGDVENPSLLIPYQAVHMHLDIMKVRHGYGHDDNDNMGTWVWTHGMKIWFHKRCVCMLIRYLCPMGTQDYHGTMCR